MEKPESLAHLSDEVLTKSYNTAKGILTGFAVVFILLILTAVYITVKKGFGVFTILPIVFMSVFVSSVSNFNKLKGEMKSRNLLN